MKFCMMNDSGGGSMRVSSLGWDRIRYDCMVGWIWGTLFDRFRSLAMIWQRCLWR
jgi:hypothetical protein